MTRQGRRNTARRARGGGGGPGQQAVGPLTSPYGSLELLSADQLEAIHQASLTILSEIGMDFLHPDGVEILRQAGAEVADDGQRVRFDPALVERLVGQAPAEAPLTGRGGVTRTMGGREIVTAAIASAPYVSDTQGGRRTGNFEDFKGLVKLGQQLNAVHVFGGYPVEPQDLDPETRHLDCCKAVLELSDKPYHAYSLGRQRVLDVLELTRIAAETDWAGLRAQPRVMTVVNTSSPLRLDAPMIEGLIEMARAGQPVVITPFTLSGAMAPVSLAGALAQQNAEALAGIALVQAASPGAPAVYGGFTSNVDMRSGSPAFGTPEYAKAVLIGGQLARRYGLPYRSSNVNACQSVDAQAAYESMMSLWPAMLAPANLIMHAAGWLEGGLVASYEKMVLDAELLQMMGEVMKPPKVDADELALEAIREVQPGGHFFGTQHTMERYQSAFYTPLISDWRNYESWLEAGGADATERAHRKVGELLANYEAPALDEAVREELDAFVARRKAEHASAA
jgi:trimethylamine--corrinoid protein Co-methyltransferase